MVLFALLALVIVIHAAQQVIVAIASSDFTGMLGHLHVLHAPKLIVLIAQMQLLLVAPNAKQHFY